MKNGDYLDRLSPCGLHCGKCFAFVDGDIHTAALSLKENLGNFEPYAARFAQQVDDVFEKYADFKAMLDYFAAISCGGCRKEKCKFYKNCQVRPCALDRKHVDYCCECDEFPCDHSGLDDNLHARSVAINQEIQKIGPEEYYEKIKDKPRY